MTDRQGSFSVYVPQGGDKRTYFRLGGENPYLPSGDPAADFEASNIGVYTYTDGKTKNISNGTDTLSVVAYDGNLNTVEYYFEMAEQGLPHTASWSRASSTSISLSDSRSVSFGYDCDFALSAKQSLEASTGFEASMGAKVEVKLDPLSVEISKKSIEVKSLFGDFKVSDEEDLRGYKKVSLTSTLADVPAHMATLTNLVIAYQVAVGVISGLSAAMFLGQTISVPALGEESISKDGPTEEAMKSMAIGGVTVGTLISLLHIAGMVLGAVAVAVKKASKATDVAATQLALTQWKAQFRCGVMSYIEMTPGSITINAPKVTINALTQSNTPATVPVVPL